MPYKSTSIKVYLLVFLSIWLIGCTPGPEVEIDFDDTHQIFLERTVQKFNLSGPVREKIPSGASVCVVSMERDKTLDVPVVALIEDNLIDQLMSEGYTVLERDDNLVRRIIQESSDDSYQYTYFPGRVVVTGHSSSIYGNSYGYGIGGGSSSSVVEGAIADTVIVVPTNMKTADYIVAYRVLECGLVYRKADDRSKKKREAQVRLHLRIHEAQSGSIVLAGTYEVRDEDLVDKSAAKWLGNYHYTFFGADYPRFNGEEYGTRNIAGQKAKGANDVHPR